MKLQNLELVLHSEFHHQQQWSLLQYLIHLCSRYPLPYKHLSDTLHQERLLHQKVYLQRFLIKLQYSRNLEKQLKEMLETWLYNLEPPELNLLMDVIDHYAQELEIVRATLIHLGPNALKADKDSLRISLKHLLQEYLQKLLEEH